MMRKEAIKVLKDLWRYEHSEFSEKDIREALDMAIKALWQEPCEDAISRRAVLAIAGDSCLDLNSYEDTQEFCDEIKALPSVAPQVICLSHEIDYKDCPAYEPKAGWIPVSERLPEIHNYLQEYIVTIKGNFIRTAFFTECNGKSWWSIDNVIAWMPLPKPYKAESEGTNNR